VVTQYTTYRKVILGLRLHWEIGVEPYFVLYLCLTAAELSYLQALCMYEKKGYIQTRSSRLVYHLFHKKKPPKGVDIINTQPRIKRQC
jgi:hypothetical protein